MNEKPKAVFSHTLEKAEWGPAEIFGGNPGAGIADLKARDDGGTVLVHGGPDFAKSLTRLGLVGESRLTTVPIAIGAGGQPILVPSDDSHLLVRHRTAPPAARCSATRTTRPRWCPFRGRRIGPRARARGVRWPEGCDASAGVVGRPDIYFHNDEEPTAG